jgi:multicomponent Na+:H+ antiporter subunit C
MTFFPYVVAAWIVLVGLYGVVTSRNLIHLVLCLSIMQSASYLVLLSIGYKNDAVAPIFDTVPVGTRAVDPVVQALTLTDVVVGVTVTALLLALAVQAHKRYGTLDPEKLRPRSRRG